MTDDDPAPHPRASQRFMADRGLPPPEPMSAAQQAEYDRRNAAAEDDLAARIARRLGRR